MAEPRRAVARVDLGAIERNCARLASTLRGEAELCAVVKADGYGHGAVPSARAALAGGARRVAVAAASEAAGLRAEIADAPILTMGAMTAAELEQALRARSDVAVWTPEFLEAVATRGAELRQRPRVHLKFDSGMGRLGERDPDAVLSLLERCLADQRVEPVALWTHLATADETDGSYMSEQLERFSGLLARARELRPGLAGHAANSAATLRDPGSHFDMVRCGIAIYGLDPFHGDPADRGLEPALELCSYVAAVKRFGRGESAGYGRRWLAPRETWVGVLPIGYGDGVRRGLSGNGEVLVEGRRYPVVGTISMDNLTIDLGAATDVAPGAAAVVIGAQGGERITCEEVAGRLATISYEVACGISGRVPREHVGGR